MQEILAPAAITGIIIGLAEVVKQIGCPKRWIPLFDVIMGLILGIAIFHDAGIIEAIMIGLAQGLSACGLYSGVKNTMEVQDGENMS